MPKALELVLMFAFFIGFFYSLGRSMDNSHD